MVATSKEGIKVKVWLQRKRNLQNYGIEMKLSKKQVSKKHAKRTFCALKKPQTHFMELSVLCRIPRPVIHLTLINRILIV